MGSNRGFLRRSRTRRLWVAAVAAAAVLGAGYYGFQLQYPAAKAGRACGGMLPVDSVLDVTGKSRLSLLGGDFEVSSHRFDVSDDVTEPDGLATRCNVGGVEISIETTAGAHNPYGIYTFQNQQDSLPVPLGTGWQGFMVTEDDEVTASVLLSCENWEPREGSGILATIESAYGGEITRALRLNLARALTGTAVRAADKTGCVTHPGSVSELAAPGAGAKTVSADEATGTCKGMSSARTVRETAAGRSPVEECVLSNGLQLRAEYGPFSSAADAVVNGKYGGHDTPSGADRSATWTSATCGGALGIAYYHAAAAEGTDRRFTTDPLTNSERADLRRFAEQSAARHGCDTPAALTS